jgi:hypothetical protein
LVASFFLVVYQVEVTVSLTIQSEIDELVSDSPLCNGQSLADLFNYSNFMEPFGLTFVQIKLKVSKQLAKQLVETALAMGLVDYDNEKTWLLRINE